MTRCRRVKIGLFPLLFLLAICLASSISFAGSFYDATTNVISWNNTNNNLWAEGVCLDIDKIGEGMGYNFGNLTVSCASGDADIECDDKDDGILLVKATGTRITSTFDNTGYGPIDCVGQEWLLSSNDAGGVPRHCAVSSDNHFYNIISLQGATHCNKLYIQYKNDTYNPYLETNSSVDVIEYLTIDDTVNILSGTDDIYLFPEDLGYHIGSANNPFSSEWVYHYDNVITGQTAELSTNAGNHAFYNTVNTDDDNTNKVACVDLEDVFAGASIFEINIPLGSYDIFCHNMTSNSRTTGYLYTVLKVINNTDSNFDAFFTRYKSTHTTVFNVYHSPTNPIPNMTVTIHFSSTTAQNGTIYWRNKPVSSNWTANWSSWATVENTSSLVSHAIAINRTNILENYQYQYYVKAGTTIENNTDIFYNFTVGDFTLPLTDEDIPEDLVNQTAPLFHDATERLAIILGLDQSYVVNMAAMLIVIVITLICLMMFHNILFGACVFITGTTVFTIAGFLPFYMYIILAIIFAFAMVKIIKGMIE